MNPFLHNILESFWVAKKGTRTQEARKGRYGTRGKKTPKVDITRKKVAGWRSSQELTAKNKQYEAGAHLMALSSGSTDHTPYLRKIMSGLAGSPTVDWTNDKTKTKIIVGNVNSTGTPDVVIHKNGSVTPTSRLEIASGANKMWGSFSPHAGIPIQQQLPTGHLFDRMIKKGALTAQHVQDINNALSKTQSPRVAHDTTIGTDGRHAIFKEVEAHLNSLGITHIMVGGRAFSTDHSDPSVVNFSHIVRKTHFTTSAAGKSKRLALRVSGIRKPRTTTALPGNEENYNQIVADHQLGDHPSTLVV